MKSTLLVFGLLSGLVLTSSFLNSYSERELFVASPADEQAIKNIIEQETAAYFQRDSTRLFSFYADDEITQTVWNSPDGSYGSYKGFRSIHKNFTEAFVKYPKPQVQPKVERTGWFFKPFSEEWMWVNFVQKHKGDDGKLVTNYETRVMKKVKGNWKIAVMYALSDHAVVSK